MGPARVAALAALVALAAGPAGALADDDGYCQYVKGVAAADAALGLAPSLFASVGYVEAPATTAAPDPTANDTRITAGVAYRVIGAYEGLRTRARAGAECRRHRALTDVTDATTARALAARAEVLDEAVAQTDAMLARAAEDLGARRATAPEVGAVRLRVDELRALADETHRALDGLAEPGARSVAGALARYQRADAAVEREEAALRTARAFDLSVRVGYDSFASRDGDDSPYFAVVSASVNLGALLQLGANRRAAAGRRRMVEVERGGDATGERLRAAVEREAARAEDTAALAAELERQLEQLDKVGGDGSRRIAQTVWFELVKVRAEHAYLAAHVAALREVLGE